MHKQYNLSSFEPIGLSQWLFIITSLLVAVLLLLLLLLLSQDGSTSSRSSHHALVELGEAEDVVGGLISESRCRNAMVRAACGGAYTTVKEEDANVTSGWSQSRHAGLRSTRVLDADSVLPFHLRTRHCEQKQRDYLICCLDCWDAGLPEV